MKAKFNAISKIGVEIEGGWDNLLSVKDYFKSDASVVISSADYGYFEEAYIQASNEAALENIKARGEIASKPFESLPASLKWVKEHYPSITHKSCGFHIHISVKETVQYALLMDKAFHVLFTSALESWGAKHCDVVNEENDNFWSRVKGENEYCRPHFNPTNQVLGEWHYHRYTQLNFCAWWKYKTLECRVFPAFSTKSKALEAVSFFYNFVNEYLQDSKPSVKTDEYVRLLERRSPEYLRASQSQF